MTANRIKQVALSHFAKNGYDGTSLAQIANEVGIKKQSIASYFQKKEELYLAILNELTRDYINWMKSMQNEMYSEPVEKKLQYILYQSYQYKVNNPERTAFYKRIVHFPPPFLEKEVRNEIKKMEEQSSVLYREVFEEGIQSNVIKNQDPQNLLAAFYCLIDGISMQMFFYDTDEFHKRLSCIWKIFWDGIKQI